MPMNTEITAIDAQGELEKGFPVEVWDNEVRSWRVFDKEKDKVDSLKRYRKVDVHET